MPQFLFSAERIEDVCADNFGVFKENIAFDEFVRLMSTAVFAEISADAETVGFVASVFEKNGKIGETGTAGGQFTTGTSPAAFCKSLIDPQSGSL